MIKHTLSLVASSKGSPTSHRTTDVTSTHFSSTSIGEMSVESSYSWRDYFERPQVKSLCLAKCELLRDESIIMFTLIFPNLEVLDLSYWKGIYEEIVGLVLRCRKLKHMNLSYTDVDDKLKLPKTERASSLLFERYAERLNL